MEPKRSEDQVFDSVAELFGVLSTPIRLKIISAAQTVEDLAKLKFAKIV